MNQQQELVTDKAIQLFGQYGIRTITMDDVALACGMSKKTIYSLFENKDELIQIVIAHLTNCYTLSYNDIRSKKLTAPEEVLASLPIIELAFRQISYRLVTEVHKYHYNTWKKIEGFVNSVVLDFIKSNLRRGQEEGYYHSCFNNDIIAAMRLRELNALHGSYEDNKDKFHLHQVLCQVTIHYLAGIVNARGIRLLKRKMKNYLTADSGIHI